MVEKNGFDEHKWKVKIYDEENKAFGHLYCVECHVQYSAKDKSENLVSIKNVFGNFKHKHIKTGQHYENYCRKRGIQQSASMKKNILEPVVYDHESEIQARKDIVTRLNKEHEGTKSPFEITGDNVPGPAKAFLHKVRCVVCFHSMELVPRMKNLEHNLLTHLAS